MKNRTKNYNRVLLVDNPMDLIAVILTVIAMGALINLMIVYTGSTAFPTLASDCLTLIVKGSISIIVIFTALFFLRTKKAQNVPIVGITFQSKHTFETIYATACYMGIQVAVMVIRNMKMFQVADVDVFAFYLSTAVIEEITYRGALIIWIQGILGRIFNVKTESDALFINIICILVSGTVFAGVHVHYYSDPYLMSLTFLGGCSQAFWYIKSKNLTVIIIPHAIINWMAAGNIAQSL